MVKLYLKLLFGISLLTATTTLVSAADLKEASEQVRSAAAKKKLGDQPGALCLYVKGLCCPSCAIGIRKKVAKLDFVDGKQFSKGVDLDAKTQLVLIGLKKGAQPDNVKLAKAIEDAGYDPVHLYTVKSGELTTTPLPVKK
jgi:copper chaperone CopZ